jgi:Na+/melibiose symporter-like transporter
MPAQRGGLWAHRDFMRLWGAQAVSSFGARIAREGLPMTAVISLGAGPAALGIFAAVTLAAQAALGLFAGALADRLPRRALLIAADLARAVVLTAVPAAAFFGRPSLVELYAAGALMGVFNVVFDVADHAFLPELIAADALADGNSKLAATDAVAEVGGPALAGVLFQFAAPPLALLVNAATYVASALALSRITRKPAPASPASDSAPLRLDLGAGLGLVLAHPLVRPLWLSEIAKSFFGCFFAALYIIFAIDVLKLTPGMLGLTIAMGGVGGLAGAALAPRMARALGPGPTILLAGATGSAMLFLIPLAAGPPLVGMAFLAAGQLFGDGLQTIGQITSVTLRQSVLPAGQLGRAAGAFASASALGGVVGALAGGALGAAIGPRETLLIASACIFAASVLLALTPLRTARAAI